jgi:hypothetical protein
MTDKAYPRIITASPVAYNSPASTLIRLKVWLRGNHEPHERDYHALISRISPESLASFDTNLTNSRFGSPDFTHIFVLFAKKCEKTEKQDGRKRRNQNTLYRSCGSWLNSFGYIMSFSPSKALVSFFGFFDFSRIFGDQFFAAAAVRV